MDTYSVLHSLEKQIIIVMKSVLDVKNLTGSALLISTRNTVKFASDEVKYRTEVITFFDMPEISNQPVKIVVLFRTPLLPVFSQAASTAIR